MFTLPPRPPKDYVLMDVNKNLQSSLQFTPNALPRVTQTSLGKYSFPIEYKDEEVPEKRPPDPVEPVIMNKMVTDARATWVVEPSKDGFFIQDVFRRFSPSIQKAADLDPRYKHKERVFNRSYKYELDCTEAVRVDKLIEKCERETAEFEGDYQKLVSRQRAMEAPAIKIMPCKEGPPFWWKGEVPGKGDAADSAPVVEEHFSWRAPPSSVTPDVPFVRWHEEPNLASCEEDPCQRRYDLLSSGLDFRTEACNYYYKNYPTPALTIIPKKFA